jgi:hypothetical protein
MTSILGTITGSTGELLAGKLSFKLLSKVVDTTTNPDTVRVPKLFEFNITAGVINVSVPETETEETPYHITFVETGTNQTWIDEKAIVPNVATVQFASLLATGFTSSNLDTGALRIARELGKDPALLALLRSPTMFEIAVEAIATAQTIYVPKPFAGPARLANFAALILQNPDNWSFAVGPVDAAGNDGAVYTPIDTSVVTASNGRRRIIYNYDQIIPADSLGAYLKATPGGGAAPITATLSAGFTEI